MGLRSCTTALNKDGHYIRVGDVLDSAHEAVVKYPTFFSATDAELDAVVAGAPSAAYTQTYSTAARTVPAEVAAITGGESPTEAEHNLVVADLLALKKVVNAIIDDLQTMGLFA